MLVVDAKSFTEAGPWGDLLTLYAQQMGIAGLVIDGAVRDSRDIIAMGFPVFCRSVSIKGTQKNQPGRVNLPIMCGGAQVSPGDIVVGDADGVVVFPAERVEEVLPLAEERKAKERRLREELRQGASLVDLMGLRERLDALGYHLPTSTVD